jgi:3-phosphoshikimate 1-carboxyvinyltransferase
VTEFFIQPAVEVSAAGPVNASLRAPASKSLTNRALLVAALADGTSRLSQPLHSLDVEAMCRAVAGLGGRVSEGSDGDLVVEGTGGRVRAVDAQVDAGMSGTTLRFALAAAAVGAEPVTLSGEPSLLRRPVGPLVEALRQLGATVIDQSGFAPVTVRGPLLGGDVIVDVSGSSQFLSAILLAAPYAERDVTATGVGVAADAYIQMTADLMRRWGADIQSPQPGTWHVPSGGGYLARTEPVEYDASAAAHLYALAAASGGTVTVTNVASGTLQPDAEIVAVLAAMGCVVDRAEETVSVTGPDRLRAIEVDLSAMPDQLPTIAVLAALADGTSTISGVAVTRGHETDRIAAVATELTKLGVAVTETADGVTIRGGGAKGPARLETYNDHRLAMSFAALSLAVPELVIADPGCVAKTYPGFWDALESTGAVVRPAV